MKHLRSNQVENFQAFGFHVERGFLSEDEVKYYRKELQDAFENANDSGHSGRGFNGDAELGNGFRRQLLPLFKWNEKGFQPLKESEDVQQLMEDLLGDGVRRRASEGIIHNNGTPWHRDGVPFESIDHVHAKVLIYLDEAGPSSGGITLIPGSHLFATKGNGSVALEAVQRMGPDAPGSHSISANPGDLVVLNTKTIHAAFHGDGIREDEDVWRRVIYLNFINEALWENTKKNDHPELSTAGKEDGVSGKKLANHIKHEIEDQVIKGQGITVDRLPPHAVETDVVWDYPVDELPPEVSDKVGSGDCLRFDFVTGHRLYSKVESINDSDVRCRVLDTVSQEAIEATAA